MRPKEATAATGRLAHITTTETASGDDAQRWAPLGASGTCKYGLAKCMARLSRIGARCTENSGLPAILAVAYVITYAARWRWYP